MPYISTKMDYNMSYFSGGPRRHKNVENGDCFCLSDSESSFENDDDDDSYENSSVSSEPDDELATTEKVYICDYDKIYISMYDSIEKYRSLRLAKKKNISSIWNDLAVFLQNGSKTDIKTAPSILFNNDVKETSNEKAKSNNSIQSKPLIANNTNNLHSSTNGDNGIKEEKSQENKVEKVSKKKLKKQRQKEKKDQQIAKQIEKNKKLLQKSEETNKSKTQEKKEDSKPVNNKSGVDSNEKVQEKKEVSKTVNNKSSVVIEKKEENEIGDDLLDENTPFISNALKKSEKKKISERKEEKIKKPATKPILVKDIVTVKKEPVKPAPLLNLPSTSGLATNTNASTMQKKNPPKIAASDIMDSTTLGQRAVTLILDNQILKAIQFLNEAINLNSNDIRHFLNRCYCYLRTGQFKLALDDAKFVIKTARENEHFVTAKFRAGQAYCGLQNYKEAEKYLEEAYNFSQADATIHQELLRVKVLQLVCMGFRERDVLETLFHCPSVEGAISLLAEKTITDEDGDYIYRNENEIDIYNSDDEENPSLTRLFVKLSNYQQGFMKKAAAPSPSPAKPAFIQPPKVQPKIVTSIYPKVPILSTKDINEKAIWVGNTTADITKQMLEKLFSKYGNVISVGRKPNENYSFVNFDSAKTVRDLLSNNAYIEFKNLKLPIKPAKVNKPK